MKAFLLLGFTLLLGLLGCAPPPSEATTLSGPDEAFALPPAWAQDAIWYQIFVERFRNGDETNDPTLADVQPGFADTFPASWSVTGWGSDWYAQEDWVKEFSHPEFYRAIQLRRYGGDLQGVLDKLDYLANLGINAIYFNPINDAPTLHKFDARHYRHIDRTFGPDPRGDVALMAAEDPLDPHSWVFTAADQLFLSVIEEAHKRGIRIILDYSWNHTGADFWALHEVRKSGAASPLANWYEVESFDDPSTPEDEFEYEGWFGIRSLPVLAEDNAYWDPERYDSTDIQPLTGTFKSERLRQHIFDVSTRWLDPNGDGDPSDGIDGFRLDVAAEVGMDFWREYRQVVRAVNPEAYLVGEVWWQAWPDQLLDPAPYLQGDMFDAVMNYRWYRLARGTLAQRALKTPVSGFGESLAALDQGIPEAFRYAMMNTMASHDSPRLVTSLAHTNGYKFDASPNADASFTVSKPSTDVYARAELVTVAQFTAVGAPHIYYGEELGMWGADDPDCRKPMWWDDLTYAEEQAHPFGKTRRPDPIDLDKPIPTQEGQPRFKFYQALTSLRQTRAELRRGTFEVLESPAEDVLAYRRSYQGASTTVYLNASPNVNTVVLDENANVLMSAGEKNGQLQPWGYVLTAGS